MTKTPEGADISALQREVAAIIVRDVLQEDFDDLVEGYLDEIMQASLRIIRLPGYAAVARAFETNLAGAVIASSASASRIEELERDNARLRDRDEEVREELADAWPEDREAVLAGDPAPLIAKLIRQRDEAICEHEHTRQALSDKG